MHSIHITVTFQSIYPTKILRKSNRKITTAWSDLAWPTDATSAFVRSWKSDGDT